MPSETGETSAHAGSLLIFGLGLMAGLLTTYRLARVQLPIRAGILPTWHRWQTWRQPCALGLSVAYGLFFLLASLCLATGIFHPPAHRDTEHHHTHSRADHASVLPDICDFALQVLMTTELHDEKIYL